MAEVEVKAEGDRPSFASFWKKSKDALTGKHITFVSTNTAGQSVTSPGSGGEGSQNQDLTPQEKAQIRRAQVRKAQVQHRQRKANYIKELELDVVRVRDMIAQTEKQTLGLRRENERMKSKLRSIGVSSPAWKGKQLAQPSAVGVSVGDSSEMQLDQSPQPQPQPQHLVVEQPYDHVNFPPPSATTELFADINVNDIEVTLSMDPTMGTPCYKITTSSSSASVSSQSVMSPLTEEDPSALTKAQEDQAINFILALEYNCWDHFHPKDFPANGDPGGRASCHALMASSICMSSAPDNIYKERKSVKRSSSKSPPPALSWRTSGISLESLRGLAMSLNPGDKELTPVQAWFELAAHYHTGLLLDSDLMESLKREFVGVVRCVHFGAVIERQAFESIVGRVLGPYVADQPMMDQPGLAI